MSELVKQACEHWRYVAPLLSKPTSEDDYDALVEAMDELLALVGDDEDHPLAGLVSRVGDMIEAYDELHRPLPEIGGGRSAALPDEGAWPASGGSTRGR